MAITIVSDSVLIESKSARYYQLEQVSHEHALEILNQVKLRFFAAGKGVGTLTTQQMPNCCQEVGE